MANRADWIPAQEEKLVEIMAVWQAKLADSTLQNAYGWPVDECALCLVLVERVHLAVIGRLIRGKNRVYGVHRGEGGVSGRADRGEPYRKRRAEKGGGGRDAEIRP